MAKYIINENQIALLMEKEQSINSIVLKIKNYLDKNFEPLCKTNALTLSSKNSIGVKSFNGKQWVIAQEITPSQLVDIIEEFSKDDINKSEKRTAFLKQIVMDWFNSKISKDGSLSKNLTV